MDPMVAVLVPGRCGLKHSHLQNRLASSASLWTDNGGHSQLSSQLEYQQMVPYPGTSEPDRTKAAWSRCVSCPVISTQGGYGHGDLIRQADHLHPDTNRSDFVRCHMEERKDLHTLFNPPFLESSLWALRVDLMCQLH